MITIFVPGFLMHIYVGIPRHRICESVFLGQMSFLGPEISQEVLGHVFSLPNTLGRVVQKYFLRGVYCITSPVCAMPVNVV